jgi:hypothetical protein
MKTMTDHMKDAVIAMSPFTYYTLEEWEKALGKSGLKDMEFKEFFELIIEDLHRLRSLEK